jgi:hypothetical protein
MTIKNSDFLLNFMMFFCLGATVGCRIGDPYLMRHLAAKSTDLMLVNLPHCIVGFKKSSSESEGVSALRGSKVPKDGFDQSDGLAIPRNKRGGPNIYFIMSGSHIYPSKSQTFLHLNTLLKTTTCLAIISAKTPARHSSEQWGIIYFINFVHIPQKRYDST